MIKIEVKSTAIQPRTINVKTGARAGQEMTFHEQDAYAFTTDENGQPRPYPQRITLNIDVPRGQQPYAPGYYMLDPSCFFVDRFNSLQLGRLRLKPITAQAQPAARAA